MFHFSMNLLRATLLRNKVEETFMETLFYIFSVIEQKIFFYIINIIVIYYHFRLLLKNTFRKISKIIT